MTGENKQQKKVRKKEGRRVEGEGGKKLLGKLKNEMQMKRKKGRGGGTLFMCKVDV